ncbi:MAG: AI-2E family transporter, partial [Verrucomicrobia bacterium]|nr:AI-2E family transporter [Verrucomicrobiota bacterium]
MIDSVRKRASYLRRLLTVALTLGIVISTFHVLSQGQHFFVPFVMAVLAVYLVDILSRLIRKIPFPGRSVPRTISVVFAFAIIFGLGFVLTEIVAQNARHVAAAAPKYQARLAQLQTEMFSKLGIEEPPELQQLVGTIDLRMVFATVAKQVASLLEDVTLIVIYGLFIMLERRFVPIKVQALFPDPERRKNAIR